MPKSNARWPNSEKKWTKKRIRAQLTGALIEQYTKRRWKKREEEVEEYFIHSFIPSIMFYLHLQPITFCWKFWWFFVRQFTDSSKLFFSLYLFSSLSCLAFVWISMPFHYISTTKCVSIFKIFGSANFLPVLSTKQDWARFSIRC